MPNFNRVMLMGNLTRDPELRYTKNGKAVCKFGLALNRHFTGSDGQKQKKTTFVDVTFWERRGEVIAEYFKKGAPIFIEGRLEMDEWENEKNEKRTKLYIVGDTFEFLERGPKAAGAGEATVPAAEPEPSGDLPAPDKDDIPF